MPSATRKPPSPARYLAMAKWSIRPPRQVKTIISMAGSASERSSPAVGRCRRTVRMSPAAPGISGVPAARRWRWIGGPTTRRSPAARSAHRGGLQFWREDEIGHARNSQWLVSSTTSFRAALVRSAVGLIRRPSLDKSAPLPSPSVQSGRHRSTRSLALHREVEDQAISRAPAKADQRGEHETEIAAMLNMAGVEPRDLRPAGDRA